MLCANILRGRSARRAATIDVRTLINGSVVCEQAQCEQDDNRSFIKEKLEQLPLCTSVSLKVYSVDCSGARARHSDAKIENTIFAGGLRMCFEPQYLWGIDAVLAITQGRTRLCSNNSFW